MLIKNYCIKKLETFKLKLLFTLTSITVTSYDTENHEPTSIAAPTKGFMKLDHSLIKFSKNTSISYENYEPKETPEWTTLTYKENEDGDIIFEGHILAHAYANNINKYHMSNWLINETTSKYMAECYEVLDDLTNRKIIEKPFSYKWYKFSGLLRNSINHNYHIDWKNESEKYYFNNAEYIEYENCKVAKSDRKKHFIQEWEHFSPWLMLKLAKEIEDYIRRN